MESYKKGKKVAYFYNQEVGKYYYGKDHPMKPKRIAMAHSLIVNFGLYKQLNVYTSRAATEQEMCVFHDKDYIKYLANYVSTNFKKILEETKYQNKQWTVEEDNLYKVFNPKNKHNFCVGESSDCPAFDGLYNYSQLSTGASLDSARLIINQEADICINWAGGLHHARKAEASGFCYVNDIVLSILELLKYFQRVMYVDIDVHHGDGVEEAFFLTNRVMTVSFHQYGDDFFPGSGSVDSFGDGEGRYHAVNVPLRPGITDEQFQEIFKKVIQRCQETFRAEVFILQGGADSLIKDKLGKFNLTLHGHAIGINVLKQFGVPIIQIGGGGYTVENVARCWAYETSISLGNVITSTHIPQNEPFYDYYVPDQKLHINPSTQMINKNDDYYVNNILEKIFDHLKQIQPLGIQFHDVPKTIVYNSDEDEIDVEKPIEQKVEDYTKSYQVNKAQNI